MTPSEETRDNVLIDPLINPRLIFTPAALRFLALAILQTEDGYRLVSGEGDDDALDIIAMLHNLGLL